MSVGTVARDMGRPLTGATVPRVRTRLTPATAAVGALTVLAAVLRFTRLGHQGFWFDEANTAFDLHFSLGKMLGLLPQNETTPPFFYIVAWVWARGFGYGEAALRSLTALIGVLTVPVAYGAATKLISRRAGVIAAALTACNPFLIWYSQEFRPYALLVLLSGLGLIAFAYAREQPTRRRLTVWAITSALALATHYYALLVVVPEAVWLLAFYRHRRDVQVAFGSVGLCGLALLPLAISQNGTGNASWIAPIPLDLRLEQVVPQFLIGFQTPVQTVLEVVAEAIAGMALVALVVRPDPLVRRGARTAGLLVASGLVLNLLLIAAGIDDLITRNVLALWLPAVLLVAAGLGARRSGILGIGGAAVLCAIGIVAVVCVNTDRGFQRPDWRGVARVLGSRPAPGVAGRAILVQRYPDRLPLGLYMPGLYFWPRSGIAAVNELDVVSISAPRVRLCWWGAACNLTGSRMQSTYAIPGFHELWLRRAYQFSVMRLVSSAPVALTEQMVSRVLTTTRWLHDRLFIQR